MTKPHIVFYSATRLHLGGIERSLLQIISSLSEQYRFSILSPASEHFRQQLTDAEWIDYPVPRAFHPVDIRRLARKLKNELRADIVHTVEPRASTVGCPAGKLAGIAVVHWHSISPLDYEHGRLKKVLYPLGEAVLGWLFVDAGIFVAETVRRKYVRRGLAPSRKSHYIPRSLDAHLYPLAKSRRETVRDQWEVPGDSFLWVNLGRYAFQKAQDVLIDAASLLPDTCWQLLIAGGGELHERLQAQVERLELGEHVRLVGGLPHVDAIDLLAAADGFVLPSRYENMPNALMEAMTLGIPAVITVAGDSWFLAGEGELDPAALCVPQEDPQLLADAMQRVMSDAALRDKMTQAGPERMKPFAKEKMLAATERIYQDLLE